MTDLTLGPPITGAQRVEGLRVLVVGINYAPEHTGHRARTRPRPASTCRGRARRCRCFAGVPHYPHWSTPGGVPAPAARRRAARTTSRSGACATSVPSAQTALTRGRRTRRLSAAQRPARSGCRGSPTSCSRSCRACSGRRGGADRPAVRRSARWSVGPGPHGSRRSAERDQRRWPGRRPLPDASRRGSCARPTSCWSSTTLSRATPCQAGVPDDRVVVCPNWTHVAPPRGDRRGRTGASRLGRPRRRRAAQRQHGAQAGAGQRRRRRPAGGRAARRVRFVLMGDGSQREQLQALGAGVPRLQFLPPVVGRRLPGPPRGRRRAAGQRARQRRRHEPAEQAHVLLPRGPPGRRRSALRRRDRCGGAPLRGRSRRAAGGAQGPAGCGGAPGRR